MGRHLAAIGGAANGPVARCRAAHPFADRGGLRYGGRAPAGKDVGVPARCLHREGSPMPALFPPVAAPGA